MIPNSTATQFKKKPKAAMSDSTEQKLNDALGNLASATDVANNWARESGVPEAKCGRDLRVLLDRLWSDQSAKLNRAMQALEHLRANQSVTACAGCNERKPTPYRRDDLGGYVCLTCVERYLDETLHELAKTKKSVSKIKDAALARINGMSMPLYMVNQFPAIHGHAAFMDYCDRLIESVNAANWDDYVHIQELRDCQEALRIAVKGNQP